MSAHTTVTRELAAKYPALAGKVGKSVTASELHSAKQGGAAEASAPAKAPARAPRKTAAKKVAKKASKKKAK